MAKFILTPTNGEVQNIEGTFKVSDESGLLRVKPDDGNVTYYAPHAWWSLEVTERGRTGIIA